MLGCLVGILLGCVLAALLPASMPACLSSLPPYYVFRDRGIVAIARERDMHSSRIWPLGLRAWLCVRQVSWRGDRAPGWRVGRSDGSCLLGCLGCIDVGMHVCLPALSGLKHGWLPPPSRTPCPCCVGFTLQPFRILQTSSAREQSTR